MNWLGVDLAKEKLDVCIVNDKLKVLLRRTIKWEELRNFIKSINVDGATIEWTGYYTLKFYDLVHDLIDVYVVNGRYTAIERKKYKFQLKTDAYDSFILAKSFQDLAILRKLGNEIIKFKQLREVIVHYESLAKIKQRVNNLKESVDEFMFEEFLKKIDEERKYFLGLIRGWIKGSPYKKLLDLPGISYITLSYILAYTLDIRRFPSVKEYWSYVGAVKKAQESGKAKYSLRNKFFHRKLNTAYWMATKGALNTKGNNEVKEMFYKQKEKGKKFSVCMRHAMRVLSKLVYYEWKRLEE